jgi:sodium-dependent dicarboxylate transporter 2/3/5
MPRDLRIDKEIVGRELRALGPPSYQERVVMAVGTITALLWVFRGDLVIGSFVLPGWARLWDGFALVDDSTVGVAMGLLLFLIPARGDNGKGILEGSAFRQLPWDAILLFGGGFALAGGFVSSGLTAWLAERFAGFTSVPVWLTVLLGCLGVALVTEFVSNIATVQMFLPVLASLAIARGIHPLLLMVPTALTAGLAFMFPVGTPPNAVIFGSDRVKVFEMAWAGLFVKVVALALTLGVCALLLPLVFQFDPGSMPDWARP